MYFTADAMRGAYERILAAVWVWESFFPFILIHIILLLTFHYSYFPGAI